MPASSVTSSYWEEAKHALADRDPILAKIIQQYPSIQLERKNDAFNTLARAIVGQQISVKAADSIWLRFTNAVQSVNPAQSIDPSHILATPPENLRAAGLSQRKVEYMCDLASHFASERLNPATWSEIDDEDLIAQLTNVRGIGRWTAEMFLIFHLLRPNIFPIDDLGLQRAIALHYYTPNTVQKITPKLMRELGKNWQPWRSVATWYLWRSLDPIPVEY